MVMLYSNNIDKAGFLKYIYVLDLKQEVVILCHRAMNLKYYDYLIENNGKVCDVLG
jgi:hypothetical protein